MLPEVGLQVEGTSIRLALVVGPLVVDLGLGGRLHPLILRLHDTHVGELEGGLVNDLHNSRISEEVLALVYEFAVVLIATEAPLEIVVEVKVEGCLELVVFDEGLALLQQGVSEDALELDLLRFTDGRHQIFPGHVVGEVGHRLHEGRACQNYLPIFQFFVHGLLDYLGGVTFNGEGFDGDRAGQSENLVEGVHDQVLHGLDLRTVEELEGTFVLL